MDLSIAHGQVHYFLYQAMLTFKTYANCVLSTVKLISKQFDFIGSIFSAANRKKMPPRFPRNSPATIRQPTVHVPCTRPDCVLPGCINLKLQTMNNETRKTKMHGSGPKSRWGYAFIKLIRRHAGLFATKGFTNLITIAFSRKTIMLVNLSSLHPKILIQ